MTYDFIHLKEMETINIADKTYPRLLKEISDPPATLFILGNLPDETAPKIAIVGTRKATEQGRRFAKNLAKELSEAGIVIVSGLAMGIDTACHEGAVATGARTIAVLGNGLNKIYPAQNENLAKKILELNGAIISEYSPDEPAYPTHFLERNRIVSGLSIATIVMEAPLRSGSLVTARLALEQNREVLVTPGPADHFNYKGSHLLIRDGARLITSAQDVLEDLRLTGNKSFGTAQNKPKKNADEATNFELTTEEKIIFDIIKNNRQTLNIDKIIELSKLETQIVNRNITLLTIKGIIKETAKGFGYFKKHP